MSLFNSVSRMKLGLAAGALAVGIVATAGTSKPAEARAYLSFGLGIPAPIYVGPPAYYGPRYYAPPAYYGYGAPGYGYYPPAPAYYGSTYVYGGGPYGHPYYPYHRGYWGGYRHR